MDHRELARAYVYAVVLALVLIGLTGAWIRLELATVMVYQTTEFYWRVFTAHSMITHYGVVPLAITATIGHRMLPDLLGRPGLALISVGWTALLASLLGTALLVLLATPLRAAWMDPSAVLLLGIAMAGMGVPLLASCLVGCDRSRVFDSPLALGSLLVGLVSIVGGCMTILVALGQLTETATPATWLEFGGIALITQVMRGDAPLRGRSRVAIGIALPVLGANAMVDWVGPNLFALDVEVPGGRGNLLGFVGTLALLVGWRDLMRARPLPPGPLRSFVAAFVIAFVLRSLQAAYVATLSLDIHIHDTYFLVGLDHLRTTMALLLALPAGVLWCWPMLGLASPLHPGRWSAAAWLSGLAVPGFAIISMVLGHQGMPRRYIAYLPEYWPLQFALSVVSAALMIGVLIWALDLARAAWTSRE